jgi:hypothetical protein
MKPSLLDVLRRLALYTGAAVTDDERPQALGLSQLGLIKLTTHDDEGAESWWATVTPDGCRYLDEDERWRDGARDDAERERKQLARQTQMRC